MEGNIESDFHNKHLWLVEIVSKVRTTNGMDGSPYNLPTTQY